MTSIDQLFQRLRKSGKRAFIPFITAGDPDVDSTVRIGRALADTGADLIELGFPYSDPIADGPVIQASYTRTLAGGVNLDDMFAAARNLAEEVSVPLVSMVSFSIVLRRGPEQFVSQAKLAGLRGLIVPDMPLEESSDLVGLAKSAGLSLIQLVTPTTPLERAVRIAEQSSGFLYCVSVTGITGEREQLPIAIRDLLGQLRQRTKLPLCVGFGISRPEHVRLLKDHVDGLIVGSAIVRRVEQANQRPLEEIIEEIKILVTELSQALNSAG